MVWISMEGILFDVDRLHAHSPRCNVEHSATLQYYERSFYPAIRHIWFFAYHLGGEKEDGFAIK